MKPLSILLLLLVLPAGVPKSAGQAPSTNRARVPEIPLKVTDPGERLRLIMSQGSFTNAASPRTEPAAANPNAAAAPGVVPKPGAWGVNLPSARHVLREGDFIELRVYQEEDLTARVRLDREGEVTLPLLGTVRVGGQTVEQARRQIETLLEKDYLVSPQVWITVVEYAKRRFAVMGEVQHPGFYNIPENESLNLLQALSMAGGFTSFANRGSVIIKRVVNGAENVFRVDAKAMARNEDAKLLQIQAEDTIIVNLRVF